jgi:hypothetical protein
VASVRLTALSSSVYSCQSLYETKRCVSDLTPRLPCVSHFGVCIVRNVVFVSFQCDGAVCLIDEGQAKHMRGVGIAVNSLPTRYSYSLFNCNTSMIIIVVSILLAHMCISAFYKPEFLSRLISPTPAETHSISLSYTFILHLHHHISSNA